MKKCCRHNHDTYIESVFIKKLECEIRDSNLKRKIKIEWLADKEHYSNLLETVKFEFINYSLHDSSHSISILQNIYLLLGKEKIDRLSVGDLWLLLESAYSHDLGMTTCYEELVRLWKNDYKIERLIKRISNTDDKEVIKCLKIIKGWINDKNIDLEEINIFNDSSCWPLDIRKAVTYINSEYIRSNHASRSRKMIEDYIKGDKEKKIEDRLYQCVAIINEMHGCNINQIYKSLEKEALGFETDIIHPQLIAYLLRVGDVMDIRNNRFEYLNIIYNGGLSPISNNHYQKHKAVTHFYIDVEKVEIIIKSQDIAVCKNSREWLDLVDNELSNLRKSWNSIAPKRLYGLKLTEVNLKVLYNGNLFDADGYNNTLKTDSKKLMDLLSGSNLYNTKLIMFREYIQNSVDATKIELASKLLECKVFLDYIYPLKFSECIPQHVNKFLEKSGDESIREVLRNKIEVLISPSTDSESSFNVKIIDRGIGMDAYGINALFNIGKGWSGRKNIENIIKNTPDWLKPTGGFGIGFLSGFLLCDRINIETKSQKGPQYILSITSPNSGAIVDKTINNDYYGSTGTTVSFDIPFYQYYSEINKYFKANGIKVEDVKFSLYDTNDLLRMVSITLDKFIGNYIEELFFDITINVPDVSYNKSIDDKSYILESMSKDSSDEDDLIFWNKVNYSSIKQHNDFNENHKTCFGYKGFTINRQNIDDFAKKKQIHHLLDVCDSFIANIGIFQPNVENILLLTRDNFQNDYNLEKLLDDILKQYLEELSALANMNEKAYKNKIKNIKANEDSENNFRFLLFRYMDTIINNIDNYKNLLEGYDAYVYDAFIEIKKYILIKDDNRLFEIADITNDLYNEFNKICELNYSRVTTFPDNSRFKDAINTIANKISLFKEKTMELDEFINDVGISTDYKPIELINMVIKHIQNVDMFNMEEVIKNRDAGMYITVLENLATVGEKIKQDWDGDLSIEQEIKFESLIYHLFKEKEVYCISLNNECVDFNQENKDIIELLNTQNLFDVDNLVIDKILNLKLNIGIKKYHSISDGRNWNITKIYFEENKSNFDIVKLILASSLDYQEYISAPNKVPGNYSKIVVEPVFSFGDTDEKVIINPFERNLDGKQSYSLEYYVLKKHVYDSIESKLDDLLKESKRLDFIVNYISVVNNLNSYETKIVKEVYIKLMRDVIIEKVNSDSKQKILEYNKINSKE